MRIFTDGDFGYCDVTELTPDERLALLKECQADGWDALMRGTHAVEQLRPHEDPEVDSEWVEVWYFKRCEPPLRVAEWRRT